MFNTDLLVTLSQAEVENTNLFPFPFGMHITFAVISLFFFVYRFFTDKKPYQIIFAVAVPLSLTLWASESRKWFPTKVAACFKSYPLLLCMEI